MQERVKVYTRPRCLFCHQVIDLLKQSNIAFSTIEVPDRKQQDELTARHRATAFPLVLLDGRYIGGYAHILHLHAQGRLPSIAAHDQPPAEAPVAPAPSAISSPAASRVSHRSLPSLMGTMSKLQQALSEDEPKKR